MCGGEGFYDSLLGLARYLVMSYDLLSPKFEGLLLVHTYLYMGNTHYLLFSFCVEIVGVSSK
jgi:hypothetical protein